MLCLKSQLKGLLKKHDLTAAQLSRKTGISSSVISDWLSGTSPRNLGHIRKVARVFNMTIDELCFGEVIDNDPEHFDSGTEIVQKLFCRDLSEGIFEVRIKRLF